MAALIANPHLQLELYLHQLMPALLTCALTVGQPHGDAPPAPVLHAALREHAASVVARLCRHYAHPVYNLTARTATFALNALLDAARPLPTQYGCIATLRALGPGVVQVVLVPHAVPLLDRYEPEGHEGAAQSHAGACRGLLVEAVAQALTAFLARQLGSVGGLATGARRVPGAAGPVGGATRGDGDGHAGKGAEVEEAPARAIRGRRTSAAKSGRGRGRGRGGKAAGEGDKGDKAAGEGKEERVQRAVKAPAKEDPVEGPLTAAYAHVAEELLAQVPSRELHAVVFL